MAQCACDMKGFLSFLILWELRTGKHTGSELAESIGKRKGNKLTPGTIYPALKELTAKGLITPNDEKQYSLTVKGKKELDVGVRLFCTMFSDFEQMQGCCKR